MGVFHLGPRLIETLRERAGETGLWLMLKRCMLDFHNPSIPHAPLYRKKLPDGKARTTAIWDPAKTEVVSFADYVAIDLTPLVVMSWEGFLDVSAEQRRLVDEDQPLVAAYAEKDLPDLFSRARSFDRSQEVNFTSGEHQPPIRRKI